MRYILGTTDIQQFFALKGFLLVLNLIGRTFLRVQGQPYFLPVWKY
jgi:hypothetical protein